MAAAPSPVPLAPQFPTEGLGALTLSQIHSVLPSGSHAQQVLVFEGLPSVVGVLFEENREGYGAGIWEEAKYWHDLGPFDTPRDARQACQALMAMIAKISTRIAGKAPGR